MLLAYYMEKSNSNKASKHKKITYVNFHMLNGVENLLKPNLRSPLCMF